jgi:hypothetical protein
VATYPTYHQTQDSAEEILDDLAIDRATSGAIRIRAFYVAPKRRFTLRHTLNATETAAIVAFYNSYRLSSNVITWQREKLLYSVRFEGPPKITSIGAGYCNVEVRFAQE